MELQVKRRSGSLVIVLPAHYVQYMKIKEGMWIDVSDISIIKSKLTEEVK